MSSSKIFSIIFSLIICLQLNAQKISINILDSGRKISLRGLSVVNDNIIWASGNNGTVARSINGGKTFAWLTVKGFEQRDFRDVEAFDSNTALIMAVAEPAIILKTKDGGKDWYKVFEDTTKGMFLDAMDFANDSLGIVIGDPINNKIFIATTPNAGEKWFTAKGDDTILNPVSFKGEAFFAASGTNIAIHKNGNYFEGAFVSGGTVSRIFYNEKTELLPIIQGKETTGTNSVAIDFAAKKGVVVGGDFANDKDTLLNCILINLKDSIQFIRPQTSPHGYRSCVAYISKNTLICCGTNGVDISTDGGINWQLISTKSFNVCVKAKNGSAVFLAGVNGKIAKME
ncbi:MAG: WD40/YVTN/BNR-like repeat-containing protein [Chitinophagaceae bacterium]